MSKEQNSSIKLFCKFYIFYIIITAFVCYSFVLNINAFSVVSSQQCDKELEKYCSSSEYENTISRLKCVEQKKSFFTYECVVRILGLDYNNKQDKNDKADNDLDQDIIEAEADILIDQSEKISSDPENGESPYIMSQQERSILILKENLLRINCLSDISRLCNVKTRKGNVIFKEPINNCIDKMIKREARLTLNCHNAILNIINEENKQYTFYNVNGITVSKRKNLRHAKREKEQKNFEKKIKKSNS